MARGTRNYGSFGPYKFFWSKEPRPPAPEPPKRRPYARDLCKHGRKATGSHKNSIRGCCYGACIEGDHADCPKVVKAHVIVYPALRPSILEEMRKGKKRWNKKRKTP